MLHTEFRLFRAQISYFCSDMHTLRYLLIPVILIFNLSILNHSKNIV